MARQGVGHGVEVVLGGASQNQWHRDARGTGKGRWIGTREAESLTCGFPTALFWSVRRVVLGACGGRRAGAPPATRGAGEVEREVGSAGGRLGREGAGSSGDQDRAAPSDMTMPVVITVLGMPVSASAPNSQPFDPKEMGFSPLCAKFKTLQLC